MTAKRRLVPLAEVKGALDFLREQGLLIGAVDIRADGVTFYPPTQTPGNDFDRFMAQDSHRDRPARNQ